MRALAISEYYNVSGGTPAQEEERPPHYINQDSVQTVTITGSNSDPWSFLDYMNFINPYALGAGAGMLAGAATYAVCTSATVGIGAVPCAVVGTFVGTVVGAVVQDVSKEYFNGTHPQ